jgi:type III restriction enzyme
MAQRIENPILNSPYDEPDRHWKFDDEGITNEVVKGRRRSEYFMPIPASKRRGGAQAELEFEEWTQDRVEENAFTNQVREAVSRWRKLGWPGVTSTTRRLLEYWTDEEREKRFFFCQIEALETAIFLTEAAGKQSGGSYFENEIRRFNEDANPELYRVALKMATGTGKTFVMAMIIAWHTLNKAANPSDARFTDEFLVVTPGITIRDRLRVLLPSDPNNYYRERDVIPPELTDQLGRARIVITNFHSFMLREKKVAGQSLTKTHREILGDDKVGAFTETPDQMVNRVCRELSRNKQILVLNDESHHCYRRRPAADEEIGKLRGDAKQEAKSRDEEARVWITGLEAVVAKVGIKTVYDLSATPFFLKGSGYSEGTLFPWVVSDFSLIDSIEAGLVKIPRVPVDDDTAGVAGLPTYRSIWMAIRDHLPKKSGKTDLVTGEPKLPNELQGAIHSLYVNYQKSFEQWERNRAEGIGWETPPVFIVVCSNTNVSKLVYDYIAGWEKVVDDETTVVVPGALPLFSNEANGGWASRFPSFLVDSRQLDSGEALRPDFKRAAASEIAEFKAEYEQRYPGRDADQLTDEDLLREVMNTVGKPGKLGADVRCVVSVSMLTEGWDANTVTHILGVRAFGTQLLCEQVVGRGLRRRSYVTNPDSGHFEPEYAEVYGVPFSFIPASGAGPDPKPGPTPTRVRALEERIAAEITFPNVEGYRWEMPDDDVEAQFTDDSHIALTTMHVPTVTEMAGLVGESDIHTLDDLKAQRTQKVAFTLAKEVLDRYFRDEPDDSGKTNERPWLFPRLLDITKEWLECCVTCKDNTFPQLLLLHQNRDDAVDRIYQAIVRTGPEEKRLRPILRPYNHVGSTRHVDFDTTKPVRLTDPEKCHVSHVVADTGSWEQRMAQVLEDELPEVVRYVKNQSLGFAIPYSFDGQSKRYVVDFIACINDGHGTDDLLNLLVEVSGETRRDKTAKVNAARNLWVPAVNNHGGFGRWAFVEVTDPWDAQDTIRAAVGDVDAERSEVVVRQN